MSFRKSSHFQDPMEATGSFTGTFVGDGTGVTGITADSASYVAGGNVDGAVALADTGSYVAGANVDGAVANATLAASASDVAYNDVRDKPALVSSSAQLTGQIDVTGVTGSFTGSFIGDGSGLTGVSADSASYVAGADVDGAVALADTASYVAGAGVDGAVALADTASYVAGADVDGAVANADTASFGNPELFNSPRPIKTVADTNPYTVLSTDHTVLINAVSGVAAIDVNLPDTADFIFGTAARVLNIGRSTGSNDVKIIASGTQDIVGDPSATLIDNYEILTLQPSGATWWVI